MNVNELVEMLSHAEGDAEVEMCIYFPDEAPVIVTGMLYYSKTVTLTDE